MNVADKATRVVLIDDHQIIRAGVHTLIDELDGFTVVAEAGTAEQGLAMIEQHAPSLIVTDLSLPGMSGLELLAQLRRRKSKARTVVLSMHTTPDFVMSALKAGADGYLVKDAAAVEIDITLHAVMAGQSYLSPAISRMVVEQMLACEETMPTSRGECYSPSPLAMARPHMPAMCLTPRQSEILVLIAQGMSTKQIAWSLSLSAKTIESHRLQLMQRLGIHDVASLTLYAVKNGLLPA